MSSLGWVSVGRDLLLESMSLQAVRTKARRKRRQVVPNLELLEGITLLSATCPVISGHVFVDAIPSDLVANNPVASTSNNGLYNPSAGEKALVGAQVELLNSSNVVIGMTTTDANGLYSFSTDSSISQAPKTIKQTLNLATTPTGFTNLALSPALQLFDPNLGTLTAVTVQSTANLSSLVQVENTSTQSPSTIAGQVSGSYSLTGLGQTISASNLTAATSTFVASVYDGETDFGGTSGVTFPLLTAVDTQTHNYNTAAAVSTFIASAGHSSLTAQMTANVVTGITSEGGNVVHKTTPSASASVTVTYTYTPTNCLRAGSYTIEQVPNVPGFINGKESRNGTVLPAPSPVSKPQTIPITLSNADAPNNDFGKLPPGFPSGGTTGGHLCPPGGLQVTNITRFGIHDQPTELVVTFNGAVTPKFAQDTRNYYVTVPGPSGIFGSPGSFRVPISSAVYNSATHSVTLIVSHQLNAHYHFLLSVNAGSICGDNQGIITTVFGTKFDVGGPITDSHGHIIHFPPSGEIGYIGAP